MKNLFTNSLWFTAFVLFFYLCVLVITDNIPGQQLTYQVVPDCKKVQGTDHAFFLVCGQQEWRKPSTAWM